VQRYATEMNSQEDRLATLRKEMSSLKDKRDEASEKLNGMLMDVNLDESF
jgi:hypothetical protein